MLDFSKLEEGAVELESEPFGLRKLVEDTVALLADQAERKGVGLAIFVDDGLCDGLRGDTGRLRQILLNLISNAVKFTNHGGVTIRVSEDVGAGGPPQVRFAISDTGIGIPDAALTRCSNASCRPTDRSRESLAAPAWAWPSVAGWWS